MIKVSGRTNCLLLILFLTFSTACHAISFGEIKVYSYLGEPLVAEIELNSFKGIDPGMMRASLSSAEDFTRSNLDRPYYLNYLSFDVFTYKDRVFIAVRSSKLIQAPYMEFLLTLSWPSGNLIKEYTILLDPPPPNLSKETRPKSFSALYTDTMAQQKESFGASGISEVQAQIQMQQSADQRVAAEESLTNIVRESDNSFSDYTFDAVLPHEQERVAKLKATSLVPGVVPEVLTDEEKSNREAYAEQLKEFNLKKQEQLAAQQKKQSSTGLQKMVNNLEGLKSDIDDAANMEQVLAEDRKDYSLSSTPKPSALPPQPLMPAPVVPPAQGNLNKQNLPPQNSEPIDFSGPPPAKPIAVNPTQAPAIPTNPTIAPPNTVTPTTPAFSPTPPAPTPVAAKTGNHLYLGWILSLLLLAVGVAFAVKRRLTNKNHVEDIANSEVEKTVNSEMPLNEKNTEDLFNEPLEDFNLDDADTEHIELVSEDKITEEITQELRQTTLQPSATASASDVAEFEQEIEAIDLDKIDISGPTLVSDDKVDDIDGPTMANNKSDTQNDMAYPNIQTDITSNTQADIAPPISSSIADTSTLTLSSEGADLIETQLLPITTSLADDVDSGLSMAFSEELEIKINLAKQYLDTGDKESAKTILEEVIAVAKDSQLLEARMLLSGII